MTVNDSISVSAHVNKCEHRERPGMDGNERLPPLRMVTNGNVLALEMSSNENIPGCRAMRAMKTNEDISAGNFWQCSRAPSRANQNMTKGVMVAAEDLTKLEIVRTSICPAV